MHKDCGCIRGSVGVSREKILGSVGVSMASVMGDAGIWASDIAGCVGVTGGVIAADVQIVRNQIIGQVGIICTPSTELFLKVTPEMVWLTPDMFSSVEFEVVSNTDWIIE